MTVNHEAVEALYETLESSTGRAVIGDDPALQKKVVESIETYLNEVPKHRPWSEKPNTPLHDLPLKEVGRRTLQASVDVLNDVARALTDRHYMSGSSFRRKLFYAFTAPERRLYVGIWVLLLAFFLYFMDSAA
jgi:predicted lipoprotein